MLTRITNHFKGVSSRRKEPTMTKFTKENFSNSGGYVTYNGKFVARFKYAKAGA